MIPIAVPQGRKQNLASAALHPIFCDDDRGASILCRLAFVVFSAFLLAATLVGTDCRGQSQSQPKEPSVKPGINEMWKSADIAPLVERLEAESREIYTQRQKLAALVGLKPGMNLADVGAGSGFIVELFARQAGPNGKVYAVDINPAMLSHISRRSAEAGLMNVQTVLTREDSVDLAPNSVDIVFVCDTYHHFEYPKSSLRGIHNALRKDGELVVVELQRIPGRTEPRMLEHIRAGQEEVTREITAAGFRLLRVEQTPFLKENYVLRFRKRSS